MPGRPRTSPALTLSQPGPSRIPAPRRDGSGGGSRSGGPWRRRVRISFGRSGSASLIDPSFQSWSAFQVARRHAPASEVGSAPDLLPRHRRLHKLPESSGPVIPIGTSYVVPHMRQHGVRQDTLTAVVLDPVGLGRRVKCERALRSMRSCREDTRLAGRRRLPRAVAPVKIDTA